MRKIITTTFITLDGVMQAPGGPQEDTSGNFPYGGWMAPFNDKLLDEVMGGFIGLDFELLLGRKTYDIFAGYWPTAEHDSDIKTKFNAAKKYVVSHNTLQLTWENSELVTGDVVAELQRLKEMDGPDLWVHGSGELIQTLMAEGLIDVMHVWIHPVTIGTGKRLFASGTRPQTFRMTESKVGESGIIFATYVPAGELETGTVGE